jgi:hypothetical protein
MLHKDTPLVGQFDRNEVYRQPFAVRADLSARRNAAAAKPRY